MTFWLMVAETIQRGCYAHRTPWLDRRNSFDFHQGAHTMIIESRNHATLWPYLPSKADMRATDWELYS